LIVMVRTREGVQRLLSERAFADGVRDNFRQHCEQHAEQDVLGRCRALNQLLKDNVRRCCARGAVGPWAASAGEVAVPGAHAPAAPDASSPTAAAGAHHAAAGQRVRVRRL